MKTLLLVGGILLLLFGLLLCVAAVVVFLIARGRAASAAPAPAAPPLPVAPPPVAPPPQPVDAEATLVAARFGALEAVSGPLAGKTFALSPAGFIIGRDHTQADIVVEDPSVSKRHVWVGVRDGVAVAIDQASTNGTFLNTVATRIGQVRLTPGDTLILSEATRFVYKA